MPNRRNVLIGLGGLVAGGGALIGTGAFDTVEAERTVTVETAGDADAFLGLQIRDDLAAGEEQIDLSFDDAGEGAEGFNLNARTVLEKVLLVQNNGTQDDVSISFEDIEIEEETFDAEDVFGFEENSEGEFDDGDGGISLDGAPLNEGETAAYDLELELRESVLEGDAEDWATDLGDDSDFDVTITITAET